MPSGVMLATLCLNEQEWLPRLYEQHKAWPGLLRWIFVEACDVSFNDANPGCATADGLSTDGTTEFLQNLIQKDPRVTHVRYGWADHADPALRKIGPRNAYWQLAAAVQPEVVVVLDADEFYVHADQPRVLQLVRRRDQATFDSWTLPKREIWRPPSIADRPLLELEVTEGFWKIPCCHWFRWSPGVGHRDCHNTPQRPDGTYINDKINTLHDREWIAPDSPKAREFYLPQMLHLGYASAVGTRRAKAAYYSQRGEAADKLRRWYVESRESWFSWKPGDVLPHEAKVITYVGPVPEILMGKAG